MDAEEIFEELRREGVHLDTPRFFSRLFLKIEDQNPYIEESQSEATVLSGLQNDFALRNVAAARKIAKTLLDDRDRLVQKRLEKARDAIFEDAYSLWPNRQHDAPRNERLLSILDLLRQNKQLQRMIETIDRPYSNQLANDLIRISLGYQNGHTVSRREARQAALMALLTTLRQSVGSCFATAPAILVHNEQPELFVLDLKDLLGQGRLKRTFGGIEYSAPLSLSFGAGDLKRRIFLNSFTILQIARSPALLEALVAVQVIQKSDTKEAKERLMEALPDLERPQIRTLEWIIKQLLLKKHCIESEQVRAHLDRPQQKIFGEFVIEREGTLSATSRFLNDLHQVSNVFKSFADCALLKSWEFTIASFAETKPAFTRWNLYASLGLIPEEENGIGQVLFQIVRNRLDEANNKVQQLQSELEGLYLQLKNLESRARSAGEREGKWLQIDYQRKSGEYHSLVEVRDKEHDRAHRLANFFNHLIDAYDALFPQYFQEVYDPDMHLDVSESYDDSPAGFRLLYKHGLANPTQWTLVDSADEFINVLHRFFVTTENSLKHDERLKGLEEDLSACVSALTLHIRSDEFLRSAFRRMALAHGTKVTQDPLKHLDEIEKKPWAYTSGGGMTNLLQCYFGTEEPPQEQSRWVENPLELIAFIIDTLKGVPEVDLDPYLEGDRKSFLMHSPTHAFTLRPGFVPFLQVFKTNTYTYTWVRDEWMEPRRTFFDHIVLNQEKMRFLIDKICMGVDEKTADVIRSKVSNPLETKSPSEFRSFFKDTPLPLEQIDSYLYSALPLCPDREVKKKIIEILAAFKIGDEQKQHSIAEHLHGFVKRPYVTALELKGLLLSSAALLLKRRSASKNFHKEIVENMRQEGWMAPAPIIFADTNWQQDYFAFLINPGTSIAELWRVDVLGCEGAPMSEWKMWLNGSCKKPQWGIYDRPAQYRRAPQMNPFE